MFAINLGGQTALFSKFFSASDKDAVLAAIPEGTRRVVFIDTPATPHLVATVETLLCRGVEVIVRDHHDVPSPRNPREQEIHDAAAKMRELLGGNARISDRSDHPACSSLVREEEFKAVHPRDEDRGCHWTAPAGEGWCDGFNPACELCCMYAHEAYMQSLKGTAIVADPDPDGLVAAMKAAGVIYVGLDADAAVLDGPRSEQTANRLTPLALLLVKGMATLPPFNPTNPSVSEEAKGKLFAEFVAAASGDQVALESLTQRVEAYEAAVKVAEEVAGEAIEVAPGVILADAFGKGRHDLATLTQNLEARPGCRVTVVRKDNGPIAAMHGVQYSLAVVKAFQAETNLQELLPEGFESSPETGIISNTTFLLHVSEKVWDEMVLPALLRARLGG